METQKKMKPVPEAKKHWFWGSTYYFFKDSYGFLLENAGKFESVYKVTNPIRHIYFAHHPDVIKQILQDNNRNYHKSFGYEIMKILLGNGLLTSEDDFWRKQRRLAQPAFHKHRLEKLATIMSDFSMEAVNKIEESVNKPAINIAPYMMEVTLKIVSKSLFGSDIEHLVEKVSTNLDVVLEGAMNRIKNPLKGPMWLPTKENRREQKSIDALNEVVKGIIKKRRLEKDIQHDDLLAMLMEAKDEDSGEQMNDKQLLDECMTIFLAGHETTAAGMCWLLNCMIENPEAEEKLCKEINEVIGDKSPSFADLHNMPYSKMLIDEVLRLYPPAWIIGRRSLEKDMLNGYELPANTNILFPTFAVHRDPKWWDAPEKFIPERFSKEASARRHKYAYFPFGGGPRLCIGNNFALMEMQFLCISVFQRFKFKFKEGFTPELDPLITLRPKTGMWLEVESRKNN